MAEIPGVNPNFNSSSANESSSLLQILHTLAGKVKRYEETHGDIRKHNKDSIVNFVIGSAALCLGIIEGFLVHSFLDDPTIKVVAMSFVAATNLPVAAVAHIRSFRAENRFRAGADYRIEALIDTLSQPHD